MPEYHVCRILEGRGLVDDLGWIEADTQEDAEATAGESFDCGPGEYLEVVEVEEESDAD